MNNLLAQKEVKEKNSEQCPHRFTDHDDMRKSKFCRPLTVLSAICIRRLELESGISKVCGVFVGEKNLDA